MCRCKYDKSNTNTSHVMWLVRIFKDWQAFLIVIFTLPLKKKAMCCTKALATDHPFSSTFMNCWLWFYYWFRRGFYPKSPQPEKKNLVWPVEPASRTSPAEPAWRLGFIDGFKFICSARSMGNIFAIHIWITYINIDACKMCVITRVRSWMESMLKKLDPWLSNISQALPNRKVKVYATKGYHYLLMMRLACDQLGAYFLCHNHVPVFYH